MSRRAERPKRRAEPSRGRKIARRSIIGLVSVTLVLGFAAAAAYWKLNSNLDSAAVGTHVASDTTPKGALNVLFIGSDSRQGENAEYGNTEGRRSDALMLVHFSQGNTRIDALQIPRDTVLDLPSCPDTGDGASPGGYGMINSALEFGQGCTVRAVEALTDVHVDHFVELDFKGFANMVNALDGVGVCLPDPLVDKDARLDLPAGKQTLDGTQALALARTRHAIGDGSDLGRLGHQQMVMSAIIKRAQSSGVLARPDRLLGFLNAVTSSITVDEEISSIRALTQLANRARKVASKNITFISMPVAEAPTDPNRVVPNDQAQIVFTAMADDKPVVLKSDADATDTGTGTETGTGATDVQVRLINAARTSDIATQAQTVMTPLGYSIEMLQDSRQPAATTRVLYDGTPEAKKVADKIVSDFGLDGVQVVDRGSRLPTGVWLVLGQDRIGNPLESVAGEPVEATSRHADQDLCT